MTADLSGGASSDSQRKKSFRLPLKATSIRWDMGWTGGLVHRSFEILAYSQELLTSPTDKLVRLVAPQVLELPHEGVVHIRRCGLVVGVRAARGLRNNLVDDAQFLEVLRGDPESR